MLPCSWVDVSRAKPEFTYGELCMTEVNKELVSFVQFVALLNDELRRDPRYQDGMNFTVGENGYNFVTPTLMITENMALDKSIFDRVSTQYTIIRK